MSFDHISVINLRNSGERGSYYYDSTNNRLYIWWGYNGEYWVVLNPDKATNDATNPAKAYNLRVRDLCGTDDMWSGGVIVDNSNPNHIWVHAYYGRMMKIDISNVLAETATVPTLLCSYNKYASTWMDTMLVGRHSIMMHPMYGSDLPLIQPDRGWWRSFGWFDKENCLPVGPSTTGSSHFDGVNKHRYTMYSNNTLVFDYGSIPDVITTANGSQYVVHAAYGGDGYRFRTWTTDKFKLYTSGNIVYGPFKFDDNAYIKYVHLEKFNSDTIFKPTGTDFVVEVSNNGGTTWETYNYNNSEELHEFTSTGNEVRVKVTMTGNGYKHGYMMTIDFPSVHIYGGKFYNHMLPNMSQSFKIKGI
jgi:hypothetical protein